MNDEQYEDQFLDQPSLDARSSTKTLSRDFPCIDDQNEGHQMPEIVSLPNKTSMQVVQIIERARDS